MSRNGARLDRIEEIFADVFGRDPASVVAAELQSVGCRAVRLPRASDSDPYQVGIDAFEFVLNDEAQLKVLDHCRRGFSAVRLCDAGRMDPETGRIALLHHSLGVLSKASA